MTVLIYTKTTCPFCVRAKALLAKKGAAFQEIEITDKPALRSEMIEKAKDTIKCIIYILSSFQS
jgi:glutaredoxin 3